MDVAAIVGPVTTLLGGLGGYWLAGRNDDARDRRAAEREVAARRAALYERLEEERHTFQRDTLLELQDELQRLARAAAQIILQDEKTIKLFGQVYQIGGELNDQEMQVRAAVRRLQARVLDDQLRVAIDEFIPLCDTLTLAAARTLKGEIPEDRREYEISKLRERQARLGNEYATLVERLGAQIRQELNRRLPPIPDKDS